MNRRSFFTKLGLSAASLAVLPAATTYARKWVKTQHGLLTPTGIKCRSYLVDTPAYDNIFLEDFTINPAWEAARYEIGFRWHPKALTLLDEKSANFETLELNAPRVEYDSDGSLKYIPKYIPRA